MLNIAVQQEDFDTLALYRQLTQDNIQDGAIVTFVGRVREFNQGHDIKAMALEHYPGMTEAVLRELAETAVERFAVNHISIVHRVGELRLADQIVFVGVSSPHRKDAFAACQWIMDTLKSSAPFWKKEITAQGTRWVTAD
ncbi:MAG: hypothetical protein GJ671_02685 [Alteromonadaceae bacterium]|nr:hypothetical protein [Alteromonadaceae bacterium]